MYDTCEVIHIYISRVIHMAEDFSYLNCSSLEDEKGEL